MGGNKVMSVGSLDGINILIGREREGALPLSFMCNTRRDSPVDQEESLPQESDHAGTLILGIQPLDL